MAFNIILQTSNSEKNKLDKSITDIATLSGTLKDTTSIIDPIIVIEGDLSSYVHCNYMTIETFGRSYFVTNIKSIRNGLFEITAHVDVLTTYKDNIRNLNAIVSRQERKWNLYLDDGVFKTYQNPHIVTKAFPSGFTGQHFVLTVAGG